MAAPNDATRDERAVIRTLELLADETQADDIELIMRRALASGHLSRLEIEQAVRHLGLIWERWQE